MSKRIKNYYVSYLVNFNLNTNFNIISELNHYLINLYSSLDYNFYKIYHLLYYCYLSKNFLNYFKF